MDTVVESGRDPASLSTRFGLGVENKQAGAGRDGRTCLSREKILRRERVQGKNILADHEQDWKPYPVDPYSCDK